MQKGRQKDYVCLGQAGRYVCILSFDANQGEGNAFSEHKIAKGIPGELFLDPRKVHAATKYFEKQYQKRFVL